MNGVLVVAPPQWRPLVEALTADGHEVYSLLGSRPSYNAYGVAQQVVREVAAFQAALDLAGGPALIDLHKTGRAVGALDVLVNEIGAFKEHLATAYGVRRFVEVLLATQPIGCVVTTCTYDVPGRSVLAAADGRVPVVHLQHACAADPPEACWYAAEMPGDLVLVPGERDRRWWQRCNPAAKVLVSGNPLWDSYAALEPLPRTDPPTVLFGLEHTANYHQMTPAMWAGRHLPDLALRAFLQAIWCQERPVRVVLKARGGEPQSWQEACLVQTRQLLAGTECEVRLSTQPAQEALREARVVVCVESNLGVEALHLGIPVLSICHEGAVLFTHDPPWVCTVQGWSAGLIEYLATGINQLLDGIAGRFDPSFYNRGVDGKATPRVVSAIAAVAEHGVEAALETVPA